MNDNSQVWIKQARELCIVDTSMKKNCINLNTTGNDKKKTLLKFKTQNDTIGYLDSIYGTSGLRVFISQFKRNDNP